MIKPTLDDILGGVRQDVDRRRHEKTLRQQMHAAGRRKEFRDFGMAIRRKPSEKIKWIGEAKKASPSAGLIREDFDAVAIAQIYAKHGAAAISVLTESNYFQGSLEDLAAVHAQNVLPVLRKDFTLDEYQIVEAAALGADAVLLIVAVLDYKELQRFLKVAQDNNMSSLVEVHNEDEMNKALDAGALILGINNRNLKTLEVDLAVTERLSPLIPKGMIAVTESGYKTREELDKVADKGLDALLIGETLMRSPDIEVAIANLFGDQA